MKKIFILLFVLLIGKTYGQSVPIYTESFGPDCTSSLPAGWSTPGFDWVIDGSSSPTVNCQGGVPECTVAGSSKTSILAGADASGSFESIVSNAINTVGYGSITVTWNGFRSIPSGSLATPALTFEYSTDNITYSVVAFTDVVTDDNWHALSTISLPSNAAGQNTLYFRWSYTSTGAGNFIAFDDLVISGVATPVFYLKSAGNVELFSSWGSNTDGSGVQPTSFTANNQTFYLTNRASVALTANWTFSGANSKLNVGTGTVAINFTIPSSFSLSVSGNASLTVNNLGTLTLQNSIMPPASVILVNAGSTIDYAQAAVTTMIGGLAYSNLTISGGADKNQNGTTTVNGILNLNGANLIMSGSALITLTLNGTITGSGVLKTGNSKLVINGTGAFGTLKFGTGSTTQAVNALTVNRTSSGSLILGTNLKVNAAAAFTNGSIDISGVNLTLNGATTFPALGFTASKTSSLNIIGAGAINNNLFMASPTIGDLILNRATNLTLGNPIEVWGTVTPSVSTITTNGNLKIKQDASNKGRIGTISTGGFSGNVTAEAFAPGGNTGWALLGSNGISGQTMNNWYGQFPMALEGSATGVTSAGGYFESVQGWNEADAYGYDTTISTVTSLAPGKGFWTYLGTGLTTTSDIIITLTGAAVTGPVNMNLTKSAQTGTNLIANPYASPISWTALRGGNLSVTNAIYIYNADGPYATYVNGVGTNGGSDVIPAGQGFFVEATSGTTLVSDETNKVASNTGLMRETNSSTVGLPIKLKINGFSSDYDETAIRFHGSATNAYDNEYDARKIFQTPGYVGYPNGYSKYTTISTKGGNIDYSINSLPYALTQNAVIPVLVKVMASGQYTITSQDMQLLPPGACVTLKDKLLNVTHNIKASPYVFTISDTTSTARFELTVCADITTGVNDNNSSAGINNQSVVVKHDLNSVSVDLNFEKTTKARVSITNILGQKIVEDKLVNTQNETVYFGLEEKNQLIFVTVETDNSKVTKKVVH